jgi:hypothetical protein
MIYFKGVLVGMVAALVACAVYILVVFVFPLLMPFVLSRIAGTGAVSAGAYFSSGPVLAVALIAFAAGFYWQVRRGSKARPRAR